MASYKAGEVTKQKILSVSRELFYRNGTENTTYVQISKKANVNLGTIIYHFKSIEGISQIIYNEIVEQRMLVVEKRIEEYFPGEYNNSIKALAQYRINTQSYVDYPQYGRFIGEQLFKSDIWVTPMFDFSLSKICKDYNLDLPKEDITLHKYLFLPYAALVTSSVNAGIIDVSVPEICEYEFKIRLTSIGLSDDKQKDIFKQVDKIADKIHLKVDDHMYVS